MRHRITGPNSAKNTDKQPSGISKIVKNEDGKDQKKDGLNKKSFFHNRSKHKGQYNFSELIKAQPSLKDLVRPNKYGTESIDFSNPEAVKELNTALLKHHYDLGYWDIPSGFLCPPIPSRADYIHHVADLFSEYKPANKLKIKCLDIGAGANCIYPILGIKEYGWSFIASEIDDLAIRNIEQLVEKNPELSKKLVIRKQSSNDKMLEGILKKSEKVDVVICNPPFHESAAAANKATERKFKNLGLGKNGKKAILNFGGKPSELWTFGGEQLFITKMINESVNYAKNVVWFTSLVSKKESLNPLKKALGKHDPIQIKTIRMNHGNKSARVLAWTFMDIEARNLWASKRFK